MAVITISRQMGSWGCEIARAVAEKMGYRLFWRELPILAAQRAAVPEITLEIVDELHLMQVDIEEEARLRYLDELRRVMEETAREGDVVLVGRAGQILLKGWPEVLHVRLLAPKEVRIARWATEKNISAAASQAQIEASDRYRENYLRKYYQVQLDDPTLYDLVINTAHLSQDSSAELICCAARENWQAF